jgi:CBS domain-containing protein
MNASTTVRAAVRDVMTRDVVTVRSYTPFRQIAGTMLTRRIGAVPVVDSMGHAIGMVSRTDLIAKEAATAEGQSELWELLSRRGRQVQERGEATSAARLMACDLVTVRPGTSAARAAYLMERHGVSHLPVVDERDVVVGIVSRSDLLRAYLCDDREIREEILRALAGIGLDADGHGITVEVADGVATLSGTVRHVRDAARAAHAARGVRGIVDVADKLGWHRDDPGADRTFTPGPLF